MSARFRAAEAQGGDWSEIVAALAAQLAPLPEGANLGFLYVGDALAADLDRIAAALRERTHIADWVGTVGLGVCGTAGEYFDAPAAVALVAALPADGYFLFGPRAAPTGDPWLASKQPLVGIVHGDPRAPDIPDAIADLAHTAGLYLVGGVAASASAPPVQMAGRVVEGGLSGVLLAPELAIVTGLTQGCSPIGPVRRISEASENIILAIDGRPALDVLKEDIGELLARNLRRIAGLIFAAFPVSGSDTGDYLVRNLIAIDPQRGWLGVAQPVAPGDAVLFCRRDPASALADLDRMLAELKRRAGRAPQAGLYYSCVARGPSLFGPGSRELAAIRAALGEFPLAGFFGNGEIANDRLYGYTGVLALFL